MTGFSDPIVAAGVAGLPALYASGVSPVDVTEAYLARIERLDPAINAVVELDAAGARAEARASARRWAEGKARSPIDGAPIAVKANIGVEGLVHSAGIKAYARNVAPVDAACVARLRAAGAAILGTLNMHEAALGATNDNAFLGRCTNPHRAGFTPGGSSGGSAAAVAAGLCAAALGTDTMGSVRLPSSYCGVVGYKPALGAISTEGVTALSWTLDHVGVHARSAEDAALVARACGVGEVAAAENRPLAVLDLDGLVTLEPAVAEGFARTLDDLTSAGWRLERLRIEDLDLGALRRAGLLISEVEGGIEHRRALALDPEGFTPELRSLLAWGARQTPARLAEAYRLLTETRRKILVTTAPYAGILTPTTPQQAFAFDGAIPASQADLTALGNVLGAPTYALPSGEANGLPLSLHLIGRAEGATQALAARLSQALPSATVPEAFR
ncbi:amidase [Caulobacter flavus]|uniref:Amidase n=1 Tax=Caulobacter flavus TaxID=1679497 RepID=A0A2N5CL73_9CAUL|nr:amidase [Caulobacter flavus]AYV48328.1 amidase [Caulobacter flavus]PLR06488.1 amidase [Caulobacter flavus]